MTAISDEELREQIVDALVPYAFNDGQLTGLDDKDCYQWINAIVSLIASHDREIEREARIDELNRIKFYRTDDGSNERMVSERINELKGEKTE